MMQRNMMPNKNKSFLQRLQHVTRYATFASLAFLTSANVFAAGTHAISIFGDVKYPADFKHFDYVNPNAPKGGELKLSALGSFDTFNPFLSKGDAAAGLSYLGNSYLWDSLTVQSLDEPFSEYGLIAERMDIAKDGSAVTFYLRKEATFADGQPVTSEDVRYTFDTLKEKGRPFYDYYYGSITSAVAIDKHTIKFTFSENTNRELPLIIGQLPILPKHYFDKAGFEKADLSIPMGSGPYKIASFKAGKSVTYELRDDYWGKDLAVNRGQHNFKKITYEYFLDDTVSLEAFKSGVYDFRAENTAKNWATAYDSPALKAGKIIQEEIKHNLPAGMQGMAFNIRKPIFQDRTLREAMILALDFEWSNKNLFYDQYTRTRSYFQNSEMAATGTPSKAELAILNKWRDKLPEEVFTKEYQPPKTSTASGIRGNLRTAQQMLNAAGYTVKDNQLYNPAGEPIKFEILLGSSAFERIVLPLTRNFKVLGINATVRTVDSNQYLERMRKFDYDMVVATFGQSNSPGNEQRDFWSSAAASRNDSRNVIGIEDPIIDELVEILIQADSREDLVTACRALDRVLQWNYYLIPNWHIDKFRVAYRNNLAHPATLPPYGISLDTWWSRNAK
ncbi:MAG: extracellular solute-binding protein [Alcanivoracaceae bacterium]|nr:extracellular solute-binding protein [Alcanivoracaceae bacterium]